MSDTVAVALITASSTLLGGGLAAFAAARTTNRQLGVQERQAELDRGEQRAARRRELRRDVYLQFLNQLDGLYRDLTAAWAGPGPSGANSIVERFRDRAWQLREKANLIALEGPTSVAIAAETAVRCALDQVNALDQLATAAAESGRTEALMDLDEERWAALSDHLRRMHQDFLERARAVLGGDLPGDA
ncbi:hypothetical protein [Streptomyces sp. NRRL S-337]|uniref:hypothetical protein n=1 Tax=Streptomyces sp. NRRL S-337 TaxID=1463900 RepID=UPI00131D757B|nr:hypothetical protein [Streptomyces sp. NRRL S-337]